MRTAAHAFAAIALLAASGCRAPSVSETQALPPELKLEGVRFRVYRAETLRAFGEADGASLRRDSSEVRAQTLEATLPRQGAPLELSAPSGEGSLLSRAFEVTGGVTAARGEDVGRTETARYEPGEPGQGDGVVRGDDPVTVEGPGYRLEGTGFTLDPSARTIVVRGGAKLVAGLPKVAP
jgi:lipopolysaccharide export system protein LptC